uniref:Uncharacterized protein n=1 Tax=Oryza meridionalis TaxID=40149 RepID=A0A0E0F697_9ORYZ
MRRVLRTQVRDQSERDIWGCACVTGLNLVLMVMSISTNDKRDIDPHYAILATDVEEHEKLYDIGYDPCYPNERTDRDNVKSTKRALEMYMHMLENSGSSVLPVAEAKWKVLQAEALHEVEFHRSDAIRQFSSELDVCANKLALILEKMEPAVTRPSLIGVIGPGQGIM